LLFQQQGYALHVERPSKYGGPIDIYSVDELVKLYSEGELHPLDLKNATANALNKLLQEIQRHLFSSKETLKLLEELKQSKITR
ncbi:MAG: tyrosine--tRNA ligase, partial [Desulfurococcaceae archaeon]